MEYLLSSYYGYIFVMIILVLISAVVQIVFNTRMKKWSAAANSRNMTGEQAARMILDANGLYDVGIDIGSDDAYNPRDNTIYLAQENYYSNSIAAVGVAAHEAGHAIQNNTGYLPIKLRTLLVPAASIGSRLSWPLVLIGILISSASSAMGNIGYYIAMAGVILYAFAFIFTLITLPMEFNASRRAKKLLAGTLGMNKADIKGCKSVLNAAAMTYVVALLVSLVQLLRLLGMVRGRNRR